MAHNVLLDFDRTDAEDCAACEAMENTCPYHVGVGDGIEWMAARLRKIATDPDVLTGVLLVEDQGDLPVAGGVR